MGMAANTDVAPRLGLRPAAATFLAILPASALFVFHASLYGGWLIDDAGISFAYARNLAAGYGLVSQPGQVPVEGFSNPLWVLLIAVCYALKLFSVPLLPKLLGCVFTMASFAVFAAVVLEIMDGWEAPVVTCVGLLLTAANPGFVVWCVSGLENPLLVLLGSVLLLTALRTLHSPPEDLRRPVYAGILAGGLALTRPDAVLYSVFFPFVLLLRNDRPRVAVLTKPFLAYALSMAVPFGIYLLFRRLYFHDWLPNTYYAKPGVSGLPLGDLLQVDGPGVEKLIGLSRAILPYAPVLIPLLFVTVAFRWRRLGPGVGLLAVFAALTFLPILLLPPDWMGEYRFGTLAFPTTYLLGFVLLSQLLTGDGLPLPKPQLLAVGGLFVLVASAGLFLSRTRVLLDHPVAPLEGVGAAAWKYNELIDGLGLRHPSLLAPDLGGTLLLSHARVVDLAGLCDKRIGRMYQARVSPAQFSEYILDTVKPDLIHMHLYWAAASGLKKSPRFTVDYLDLGDGDFVRRTSLPAGMDDSSVRALKARLMGPPSEGMLRASLSAVTIPTP